MFSSLHLFSSWLLQDNKKEIDVLKTWKKKKIPPTLNTDKLQNSSNVKESFNEESRSSGERWVSFLLSLFLPWLPTQRVEFERPSETGSHLNVHTQKQQDNYFLTLPSFHLSAIKQMSLHSSEHRPLWVSIYIQKAITVEKDAEDRPVWKTHQTVGTHRLF